jgi:dTMP kinase
VSVRLRPGSVVVLEGLDGTGKTTQLNRMRNWPWSPEPAFAHMPSGLTPLTRAIYELTESNPIESPLARQLLHLACHAENMDDMVAGRDSAGLIVDRWWWSTMAYGWFGADLAKSGVSEDVFRELVQGVWAPIAADLVLVFSVSFTDDPLNLRGVREGYAHLLEAAGDGAFEVPSADPDATTAAIRQVLEERGLLITDDQL